MTAFDILKAFLKGIDLKTILIILLVVMFGAFLLFNRSGSNTNAVNLDLLNQQHKTELKEVEDTNKELEAKIDDYIGIIENNNKELASKDANISSLKSESEISKKKLAKLKKEIADIDEKFDNMDEDELLDWVRQYLKSKGIKE